MATLRSKAFIVHVSRLLQGYHHTPFLHPPASPSPFSRFTLHFAKRLCLLAEAAPENANPLQKRLRELGICMAFIPQPRFKSLSSLDLLEKIDLLLKEGVSVEELNRFSRRAGRAINAHFHKVSYQRIEAVLNLLKSIGIHNQMLGKVLIRYPAILSSRVQLLESKLTFIESLGVPREEVGKYFVKCPRAFLCADQKRDEHLEFWHNLGFSKKSLSTMIRHFPNLLALNLEQKIQPLVAHFETYGVSKDFICTRLSYHFRCIGLSMKNLSQKMEFLQQLGFKENSKPILMAYFVLCTYSPKLLQSRVEWLISKGFSIEEVRHMVQKSPAILAVSPEACEKKLDYFLIVLKRDRKEILNLPICLRYSLEKRIIPRFAILTEKKGQGSLSLESSLSSILQCTDEVFGKRTMYRRRQTNMDELTAS